MTAHPRGPVAQRRLEGAAHPPETLEGWFALHQIYRALPGRGDEDDSGVSLPEVPPRASGEGWTIWVRLIGSTADLMLIHLRPTLDAIAAAQETYARLIELAELHVELVHSFLSVTEAGLYHLTAQMAQQAEARGGNVGDELYRAQLAARAEAERNSDHVRQRLYPAVPEDMPFVCFYPMSKRRDEGQNWYTLPLSERSRLMHEHGTTGRRFAGRIQQVITGAIGLDAWEWGVTLFAGDPLDFKKLVTDMRFDEVSAKYAEFGDFYVGKIFAKQ